MWGTTQWGWGVNYGTDGTSIGRRWRRMEKKTTTEAFYAGGRSLFGHQLYEIKVHILPVRVLFYFLIEIWTSWTITPVSDGYIEDAVIINELPYLQFAHQSSFTEAQLRTMHWNLGHPPVEKQMRVIANAKIEDLPKNTRNQIEALVKHCHVCQI